MKHFLAIIALLCALPSFAQTQMDTRIFNPSSGAWLGATISMPVNEPRAGVVLISGSGSQDRDETVMGHKPFKALAEALQLHGYAVLRFDDRGVGDSDAGPANPTTDDFATDAAACLAYLDSVVGRSAPVGYIGHSEGATIAIKQASRNPLCTFIVTLGAPALRGDSILLEQVKRSLQNAGAADRWEETYQQVRYRYDLLMGDLPDYLAETAIYAHVVNAQPMVDANEATRKAARAEIKAMASPWFRSMLRYDPADDIKAVEVPWLAIGGEHDQQVSPANQQRISELNPNAIVVNLPKLNHLMLEAPTGAVDEYHTLTGDIDPAVISEIAEFLECITE